MGKKAVNFRGIKGKSTAESKGAEPFPGVWQT